MLDLLSIEVIVIVTYMTAWFLVAQALRRNDIADIAWGIGFIFLGISMMISSKSITRRGLIIMFLVMVWGMRLACHVVLRNRGRSEDSRYKKWRQGLGRHAVIRAYFQVFLLQGLLIVIISLPVTMVIKSSEYPIGAFDVFGVCICLLDFAFETLGDYQLLKCLLRTCT